MLAAAVLTAPPSRAQEGRAAARLPPIMAVTERMAFDERSGFGIGGFDPVTFFLGGSPTPGEPGRELAWNGVAWRFASEANRDAFRRDPQAYAPRLGGHDPEAMVRGRLVAAAPTLFAVLERRLYLFRTEASRRAVLARPEIAAEAEARWRALEPRLGGS